MKNFIVLMFLGFVLISCDNDKSKVMNHVVNSEIGYDFSDEGEKRTLVAGPMSNVEVWEKYIKAHNERDFETIMNMNADDFKARGPKGEYIVGSDAHKEFLMEWFEANSPMWNPKYFIANDVMTKEGELRQWVTSGHDLTLSVDGNEVNVFQIHDALIVDGKVEEFMVHERVKGEDE
jgi:uncharacterized protein YacL (UPF0231 family)